VSGQIRCENAAACFSSEQIEAPFSDALRADSKAMRKVLP